jgi:hypothetical protein
MAGYNVTVWRVDAVTGEAISVQVAEMIDGKIVRANGMSCTGFDGKPEFHAYFVRANETFCGEPCKLYVSNGTKGFKAAIGKSIHGAYVAQFQRPLTVEGVSR